MKFNAAKQPIGVIMAGSGILLALFAVRYMRVPYPVEKAVSQGMPLAGWLARFAAENPGWAAVCVLLLVLWTVYAMVPVTLRYTPATSRNYLPIAVFIAFACGIFIPGEALAAFVCALLLMLATRRFISVFHKEYRFQEAFLGGFYLGLIPLLYAPGAVLLILVPALMNLYRRSGRELTVSVIGALLPIAGAWFVLWAEGHNALFLFAEWWRCVAVRSIFLPTRVPIVATACVGLLLILAMTGIGWFAANRKGTRTRQRKVMTHISLTFGLLLASAAVPGTTLALLPLIAVPTAMVIPYAFTGRQAAVASVIYCLIICVVLTLNVLPILGIALP